MLPLAVHYYLRAAARPRFRAAALSSAAAAPAFGISYYPRAASRPRFRAAALSSAAAAPAFGISFTSPWDVLGVPRDAAREDVDEAYRRLIFQHHPDHGGTTEDFLRVKQARESLVARLDPDMEVDGAGGSGLRKKAFGQRFEEAVRRHDADAAWGMWAVAMSGGVDITADITETYLQLLTKEEPSSGGGGGGGGHSDGDDGTAAAAAAGVPELRWQGLLVSMDAFQHLREHGRLEPGGAEEAKAWNGLLWHLAQLPQGWSSMNDILTVCRRMDMLDIRQDLELLRTHIFVGRT
jgi:hypothetical protein